MEHVWIWSIRILYRVSFFVGVSYFRQGKYLVGDSIVFCVSMLWFGGCTVHLVTDSLVLLGTYPDFKMLVIFYSLMTVNSILFLSLVDFRLKNSRSCNVISLYRKLRLLHWRIGGHRSGRRFLNVFGVIAFHLLSGALFLYREETAPNVRSKVYDRFCATTVTWPTTMLCFQYCCWVQIFIFNFELVLKRIPSTMTRAEQTNFTWLSDCTLSKLSSEMKLVMQLKKAITDRYGASIIFNQLYTFICLLLNCMLLIYEWGAVSGKKQISWYKYYFVARIIYYSALSYIPHWIGQIALSDVKELLYAVRKLLITDHNTAFDKRVSNLLFNPAYDDLKFRVCNVFDLNNKQFISFLSVSVGFVIIQMQFYVN